MLFGALLTSKNLATSTTTCAGALCPKEKADVVRQAPIWTLALEGPRAKVFYPSPPSNEPTLFLVFVWHKGCFLFLEGQVCIFERFPTGVV